MKKLIFILILSAFCACSSLNEVHSYTNKAEKSIQIFNDINYTFGLNCLEKCRQRSLEDNGFTGITECDCVLAKKADKNLAKVLLLLRNYFKQLAALSDKSLSEISLTSIEKPLTEGKYIKKETLKPYSIILKNITAAATTNYRTRRLKELVKESDESVGILLQVCSEIISQNLIGTLHNSRSELQQIYHDLYVAKGTSSFEKYQIKKAYFEKLKHIDTTSEKLKKYAKSLQKIKEGHRAIKTNNQRLKKEEIRKLIASYADALNTIYSQ